MENRQTATLRPHQLAAPELLWKVRTVDIRGLTPNIKAIHGDVTALLNAGVLDRSEDGRIVFPFEAVKVEFLLQAA